MSETEKFEEWAIVEVMGHRAFAGRVTEQAIGGASFIRVDVPQVAERQAFTKLLGAGSIYCITPCDEETAKRAAETLRSRPTELLSLPAPIARDGDVYDEDEIPY